MSHGRRSKKGRSLSYWPTGKGKGREKSKSVAYIYCRYQGNGQKMRKRSEPTQQRKRRMGDTAFEGRLGEHSSKLAGKEAEGLRYDAESTRAKFA